MNDKQKLFAFKLVVKDQKNADLKKDKWKARDGVSIAGCTSYRHPVILREFHFIYGADMGVYC